MYHVNHNFDTLRDYGDDGFALLLLSRLTTFTRSPLLTSESKACSLIELRSCLLYDSSNSIKFIIGGDNLQFVAAKFSTMLSILSSSYILKLFYKPF